MTDPTAVPTEHEYVKNNENDSACQTDVNYEALKDLCKNNADYFVNDNTENGQRLYTSFMAIIDNVNEIWPIVLKIRQLAPDYDFDESVPGNGYRSFLSVINSAVTYAIQLNKKVCLKRDSVLFRKTVITKEIESCAHLIASLHTCMTHVETLTTWCRKGELFPLQEHGPDELFSKAESINQYCFYGRSLGFQFCESLRPILRFVTLSMAIFSEAYYSEGSLLTKATNSVTTTAKYISDPEMKAKRIVNISQNADVEFCKAFWFLAESELMQQVPSVVGQNVAVSKVVYLPPEPLTLTINEKEIDIPIPNSHIGRKPIQVRLLSYEAREGMIGEANNKNKVQSPSRGLLIHCHGGGFVAQSSRSHETYLREWAKTLQVPIFSIDYSLAPEAPYPRALEEVTYAYCWALKHCHLLGSTGERVIAAGDSAGANLILGMSLKCVDMNVPPPMGLFLAYAPTWINFVPSPARLLCMMDPLLPFGFMMRCLKAYASPDRSNFALNPRNGATSPDTESFEEISQSDLVELQAHKSPISEASDTLTYGSLSSPTVEEAKVDTVREIDIDLNLSDQSSSQQYVSDILEKYVLDSDTDTDGTKTAILKQENINDIPAEETSQYSIQRKLSNFVAHLRGQIGNWVGYKRLSNAALLLDSEHERNILDEFKFTVPSDPFLSPYLAPDGILSKLPPVKVLTVEMDPCLDDCVMLAKRLKKLNNVVSLDVLKGLPHGFLNFSLLSKEAHEGSKLCAQRIKELLDLDNLPPLQ